MCSNEDQSFLRGLEFDQSLPLELLSKEAVSYHYPLELGFSSPLPLFYNLGYSSDELPYCSSGVHPSPHFLLATGEHASYRCAGAARFWGSYKNITA